jgi:UDP-glucose 4-epimerase
MKFEPKFLTSIVKLFLWDFKEKLVKVLITGGAGFIGSHLAEHFQKLGDEVTVLDNFSTGSKRNLGIFSFSGKTVDGDIRDAKLIESLITDTDLVLHMAAALGVANILNSPIESISTNIAGSEVVLMASTKFKKRIVIASTSEIYGKNPKQPLSEEDDRVIGAPQNIRWSYSDAKAIEEAMARSLFLTTQLPVTTVRFFNTVGPRQTGKYGMVVPRFVQAALQNKDLVVHGDGTQSRVFCHVEDAIAGLLELLEYKESIGEVFNIGGEGEISINDLAKEIIAVTNSSSKIVHIPYVEAYPEGFEDMQRRVPNTGKIRNLTGWEPKNNLEEIIKSVVSSLN